MTPYEFALVLAENIGTMTVVEMPKPVLAQVGDIVADCEGTWVSVTNVSDNDALGAACGPIEMADITIIAATPCSITFDEDGLTDPKLLAEVSAKLDALGVAVKGYAHAIIKQSFIEGSFNGIQFVNNGGLGYVIVTFTVPVP